MTITTALDDNAQQAAALDLIVTLVKASSTARAGFAGNVVAKVLHGTSTYAAIAAVAQQTYGITVDPHVLRSYVQLVRTPAPNAAIGAFMKRVQSDPTLQKQFLDAATNYTALQQVASANGLNVSVADLQNYIQPWQMLVALLKGLLDKKVIDEAQFETYAGFPASNYGISGFGPDVDQELMAGVYASASWATKCTELSNFSAPVAAVVFPSTAVIMGNLQGEKMTFNQLGDMFAQSFNDALTSMADSLDDMHDTVSNIFS